MKTDSEPINHQCSSDMEARKMTPIWKINYTVHAKAEHTGKMQNTVGDEKGINRLPVLKILALLSQKLERVIFSLC